MTLRLLLFYLTVYCSFGTKTRFRIEPDMDGRTCPDADISFTDLANLTKHQCLALCASHADCAGVFHASLVGRCTGCKISLLVLNASYPQTVDGNSRYYQKEGCEYQYAQSCYSVTSEMPFFYGAVACEPAYPVIVNTSAENNFLKNMVASISATVDAFYIGATDTDVEGVWRIYNSNQTIPFAEWHPGEPSNGSNEGCVTLYKAYKFNWNDVSCSDRYPTLCEAEMN